MILKIKERLLYSVLETIAAYYGQEIGQVLQVSRKRKYVYTRQMYMYFAILMYPNKSLAVIGTVVFKSRDTVNYGIRTITGLYETNKQVQKEVTEIKKILFS